MKTTIDIVSADPDLFIPKGAKVPTKTNDDGLIVIEWEGQELVVAPWEVEEQSS